MQVGNAIYIHGSHHDEIPDILIMNLRIHDFATKFCNTSVNRL